VLACLWVAESLGQTKVDYVNVMLLLANSYQEIVWLYVTVKEVPRMNKLDSLKLQAKLILLRFTIWSASMRTVFKENFLLQ